MHTWYVCMYQLATEKITMNDEAAVHIDPLKPRNRGQEMMPWREIETIAKKGQISRSCVPVPGSAQVA